MFCLNTYFEIVYVRILFNHPRSCVKEFFNLYSSLGGIAENVITCSMTTSDSYQVVWNSLTTRYNNKKVLVQVHVKSLFELEPIKKESSIVSRAMEYIVIVYQYRPNLMQIPGVQMGT